MLRTVLSVSSAVAQLILILLCEIGIIIITPIFIDEKTGSEGQEILLFHEFLKELPEMTVTRLRVTRHNDNASKRVCSMN